MVFSLRLKNLIFFLVGSNEGNYRSIKIVSEKGLHFRVFYFDVVLFMVKINVAKIPRMEDNITLIRHHGGGLAR